MANGTVTLTNHQIGGLKTRDANLANDPNFYANIGRKGGKAHNRGGFNDKELARRAGAIGGAISKRKPRVKV